MDIDHARGDRTPIHFRHELYRLPQAPVIRMVVRIFDRPGSPTHTALDAFVNIENPHSTATLHHRLPTNAELTHTLPTGPRGTFSNIRTIQRDFHPGPYTSLHHENELLKAEIAKLKGQPKKPQFASSRQRQFGVSRLLKVDTKWHKGSKQGILPIDSHVNLPEETICSCGSSDFKSLRTHTKIIQGMLMQRKNTAYHGRDKQCKNCGKIYKTQIPGEIKGVSFDPTLKSLISYLKYACRMTHPLLLRMFSSFGIRISSGEISEILLNNGHRLAPSYQELKGTGFSNSTYLQSDSTGTKRKNRKTGQILNQYVQIVSNKLLSVFAVTRHYNIPTLKRILTKRGRDKPYVSDDGSPNEDGLRCQAKQLCWVHEIRHYRKLFPFFNLHQKLQQEILSQWSSFYHLAKSYGRDPTEETKQAIEDRFDEIASQLTGYDLLDKQLKLTRRKRNRLLTFLDYPFLPIHR